MPYVTCPFACSYMSLYTDIGLQVRMHAHAQQKSIILTEKGTRTLHG